MKIQAAISVPVSSSHWSTPHYAIRPGYSTGQLLLYLPGTKGSPDEAASFTGLAAELGYHVLSLAYANDQSIGSLCATAASFPDCAYSVRQAIVYGGNLPLVTVDPSDGIVSRLIAALKRLASSYPDSGWEKYLSLGTPAWGRITIAGHSQGAGHAMLLAKEHDIKRVLLFSGMGEAWLNSGGFVTDSSRIWGFIALNDPISAGVRRGWASMGLWGDEVLVDNISPPYQSHRLITNIDPAVAGGRHWQTVVDRCLPPGGYREVWRAMLEGDEGWLPMIRR